MLKQVLVLMPSSREMIVTVDGRPELPSKRKMRMAFSTGLTVTCRGLAAAVFAAPFRSLLV